MAPRACTVSDRLDQLWRGGPNGPKTQALWIALAIAAGIAIGAAAPALVAAIGAAEVAGINVVVAVLIWAMVTPMMIGIDFAAVRDAVRQPRGLVITLAVNWAIKPFTMALVAVLFFGHVFAPWIAPADAQQYIAGLILLGAAPCTAELLSTAWTVCGTI